MRAKTAFITQFEWIKFGLIFLKAAEKLFITREVWIEPVVACSIPVRKTNRPCFDSYIVTYAYNSRIVIKPATTCPVLHTKIGGRIIKRRVLLVGLCKMSLRIILQ